MTWRSQKNRGQGVSKRLLAKAEKIAIKLVCCEGNKIAQAAFTSYGFEDYELDPVMGKALFGKIIT